MNAAEFGRVSVVFINCLVHKDVPVSSLKEDNQPFLKERQICLLRKYICMTLLDFEIFFIPFK